MGSKTHNGDNHTGTYSSRGELLGVNLPDGKAVTYVHDPLGRRIAKKVNGTTVEKYLWNGLTTLLAVYDGSDNLLMRFRYADGRMPVAVEKAGATYYLAYDQVGTLRAVAASAGNVVKEITYDSFGYVLSDTNPAFEVPFGFAGGLYDKDTGLVRFGFRDYDPDTGRWTAKDPIGFAGGDSDLYGYCINDPVNLADPWGLEAAALPGPILLPIILPKTDAQIEADQQIANALYEGWMNNVHPPLMATGDFLLGGMGESIYDVTHPAADNACRTMGRGKGDKYGPLWNAPGMPGWQYPSGDPNNDKDFWKRPSDWDKMSKWQRLKWRAGKIAGALANAGGIGL